MVNIESYRSEIRVLQEKLGIATIALYELVTYGKEQDAMDKANRVLEHNKRGYVYAKAADALVKMSNVEKI